MNLWWHKLVFFLLEKKKHNAVFLHFVFIQWKVTKWNHSKYITRGIYRLKHVDVRCTSFLNQLHSLNSVCAVLFFYCFILLCRCEWSFFFIVFVSLILIGLPWYSLYSTLCACNFSIVIRYANIRKQRESWMLVQWTKFTIIVSFLR